MNTRNRTLVQADAMLVEMGEAEAQGVVGGPTAVETVLAMDMWAPDGLAYFQDFYAPKNLASMQDFHFIY